MQYLHFVNKIVSSEDVVFFVRVFLTPVLGPVGLAGAWQTDHHQGLQEENKLSKKKRFSQIFYLARVSTGWR